MARSIETVLQQMLDYKTTRAELDVFTNTSKTAIWKLLLYIVAFGIVILEKIFDAHLEEVDNKLIQLKPHSSSWYQQQVLAFQYGQSLVQGKYDNTGKTAEQIEASKIIKNVGIVENNTGRLLIKVAKISNSELTKLTTGELLALNSYIQQIKDAGVNVLVSSLDADNCKIDITVYIDPLVINAIGNNITTNTPVVNNAIFNYLKGLPFNSEFTNMSLVDAIQQVEGVRIVQINTVKAKPSSSSDYTTINARYVAEAGYMRCASEDVVINYLSYV